MRWPSAASVMARLIELRGPLKEASLKTTMYLPEADCAASTGVAGVVTPSEQAARARNGSTTARLRFMGAPCGRVNAFAPPRGWGGATQASIGMGRWDTAGPMRD